VAGSRREKAAAVSVGKAVDRDCGYHVAHPCDHEHEKWISPAGLGEECTEQDERIGRHRRNDVLDGGARTDRDIDQDGRQIRQPL
jgi:hypothetical protein